MTSWPVLGRDIVNLMATFAIALSTGWVFLQIGAPAPFMMGSLFGVWVIGANLPRLQPYLGVARWIHIPVILGLGVLVGSTFTADVLAQTLKWWQTVSTMIGVTILVTACGYFFLTRIRNYEPMMAFFCSVPGGQAEAIVMAREHVEKDYVVALFHLIRVVFVFFSTPLLLGFMQGAEAVQDSNRQLAEMPSLFTLPAKELLAFVAMGVIGYILARLIKLPMAHLLGPLTLSTIAHASGIIMIPRVFEFVMLAQLAIGGAVGARLAKVRFVELIIYFKDAILNTIFILSLYFTAAVVIAYLTDTDLLQVWLAFVPGGLYEVTLLALIFGFDIAYVAFHHAVRVVLVFITMPVTALRLRKTKTAREK